MVRSILQQRNGSFQFHVFCESQRHILCPPTHCPPSFLASTHYTNYNPWLFAINLTALVFALLPKFPQVRQVSPLSPIQYKLV